MVGFHHQLYSVNQTIRNFFCSLILFQSAILTLANSHRFDKYGILFYLQGANVFFKTCFHSGCMCFGIEHLIKIFIHFTLLKVITIIVQLYLYFDFHTKSGKHKYISKSGVYIFSVHSQRLCRTAYGRVAIATDSTCKFTLIPIEFYSKQKTI